jgi:hypothetical protein
MLKWARASVSVSPLFPTSSMCGVVPMARAGISFESVQLIEYLDHPKTVLFIACARFIDDVARSSPQVANIFRP